MVSLRRSRRSRQASGSLHDTSSFETMSIANSRTSMSSSSRARIRDTGFPESFCGNRNTSLPHPEADTSPNASISQEDIDPSRTASRHRLSFLNKSKRTISHGQITPEMEQMYSDIAATSDSDASPTLTQDARLGEKPTRPMSGGANSFNSASTGDQEDAAPKSPHRHSRRRSSISSVGRGYRKSFMEKLGMHKHHE